MIWCNFGPGWKVNKIWLKITTDTKTPFFFFLALLVSQVRKRKRWIYTDDKKGGEKKIKHWTKRRKPRKKLEFYVNGSTKEINV